MNAKVKSAITAVLLLSLLSFSGCNNSNNTTAKNATTDSKSSQTQAVQKVKEKSLQEEGYTFKEVTAGSNEGISTVRFEKNGQSCFGVLDPDFNWIIKPSEKFVKIGMFEDGLAPAAIAQTNQVLISENSDDNKYLWGYINTKGEWVIKPQYRSVGYFVNNVAIVTTIEKDRDDLSGEKVNVIDKKGNVLFEMGSEETQHSHAYDMENPTVSFTNGYFLYEFQGTNKDIHTLYDEKGNSYPLESIAGLPTSDDNMYDGAYKNKVIIENYNNYTKEAVYYVFNTDTKKLSKLYDKTTASDVTFYFDGKNAGTYDKGDGKLYDFSNKVVGNAIKPKYNSSELWNGIGFNEGKEYYVFYDAEGKVIIDESKKIKGIYDSNTTGLKSSVVKANIRPSSTSANFDDYLLNFVNLKTVSIKDLMNK